MTESRDGGIIDEMGKGGENMTLSELAKLANVSVSVASKAFSGRGDVSEAMRDHVFAVAKQHGCFHQFYNIPYNRRVVALIIPEAISKYYIKYVEELKVRLERNNCTLLLSISNFDQKMEGELIRYYSEHGKVDALIVVNGYCDFPESDDIIFVKISGDSDTADVIVRSNKIPGIDECLLTLKENGHKNIAFVGEPLTVAKGELLAERMSFHGIGYKDEYFITSKYRFEDAGVDGIEKLLSLSEPPTAVIGSYGYITSGMVSELLRREISIPDDMSIISLDPFSIPNDPRFTIACVDYDIAQFCDIAVREICKRFSGKSKRGKEKFILDEKFYIGNTISRREK